MPVVARTDVQRLKTDFDQTVYHLLNMIAVRPLHSGGEGCSPGATWDTPKDMAVTRGDEAEIQVAVDKVKAVLLQIRKIKSAASPKPGAQPKPEPKATATLRVTVAATPSLSQTLDEP